jgi:hypothetical protein
LFAFEHAFFGLLSRHPTHAAAKIFQNRVHAIWNTTHTIVNWCVAQIPKNKYEKEGKKNGEGGGGG